MGTFILSDFVSTDESAPFVRNAVVADTFDRSGPSLGATSLGNKTWVQNSGSVHQIVNKQLQLSTIPTSSQSIAHFEDDLLNGVLSATLVSKVNNPNLGLIVGYNPSAGTGYILMCDASVYSIRARSGSGGLTNLATTTGIIPKDGDHISVKVVGDQIVAFVNNKEVLSVVNNVYQMGKGKGFWAFANGGSTSHRVTWDNVAWSEL